MHSVLLLQVPLLLAALASASVMNLRISVDQAELRTDTTTTASCYWDGTSPFCAGSCDDGFTTCSKSASGDGASCVTGYKVYCCPGSTCPSSADLLSDSDDRHLTGGRWDDFCPPGKHIHCPDNARKNEDCDCLDDEGSHAMGRHNKKSGL